MSQSQFGAMYTARVTGAYSPGGSVVRAQMNANSAEVRRVNVGDIIQISENTVALNSYRWFRTSDGYIADTSAFAVERASSTPPPEGVVLSDQQVAQLQTYLAQIESASQGIRTILNSASNTPP